MHAARRTGSPLSPTPPRSLLLHDADELVRPLGIGVEAAELLPAGLHQAAAQGCVGSHLVDGLRGVPGREGGIVARRRAAQAAGKLDVGRHDGPQHLHRLGIGGRETFQQRGLKHHVGLLVERGALRDVHPPRENEMGRQLLLERGKLRAVDRHDETERKLRVLAPQHARHIDGYRQIFVRIHGRHREQRRALERRKLTAPPLFRVVVGLVVIVRHRVDPLVGQQGRKALRDVGVFREIDTSAVFVIMQKNPIAELVFQLFFPTNLMHIIGRAAQKQLRRCKPADMQAPGHPPRRPEHREHGLDAMLADEPVHHTVAPQQERAPVVAHVVLHHPHVGQTPHAARRGAHRTRKHHHKRMLRKLAQQPAKAVGHLHAAPSLQIGGVD